MHPLYNRLPSLLKLIAMCAVPIVAAQAWAQSSSERDSDKSESSADPEQQVDHLGLAARMLHDEHTDRALKVLQEVNPEDPEVDAARFYTLRGLAHLKQKKYPKARRDLELALKHGQKDPVVRLQLAQACFSMQAHECTLNALQQAGSVGDKQPAAALMKAESQWKLGHQAGALQTLSTGEQRFPERPEFQRLQLFYLIDLGLYSEAVRVSERYLNREQIGAEEYVAVGEALRAARQFTRAQLVMEGARLRFPEDERVHLQLSHAYLDAGRTLTSAMLFEQAARLNSKYTLEAAELYKEAGLLHRATWLNARVGDQKAKTKQRLGLLIDAQDFDSVTALVPKLSRLGLLADENIRYALAYAFYKTGQFAESEAHLKLLSDPQLFESAMQLRKAMQQCREAGWECTL